MKLNKSLSIFLLCHLIVWSVLPMVLRPNLPMDSAEALVWGFIGEWGTNKHPPLSGFFADIMYRLTGTPASLYVLSQLFVVGGLFYVYKLARLFLPENKSVIAALILEAVAYYSLVTPEYNVNIIALMLWPAATYHFYKAVQQNTLYDWVLFGVFAGLNILNKYVSGILLLCLGLYILCTEDGRKTLRSWKLYLSAAIAFGLIAPHIVWLHNHDYFVVDYFLGRSGEGRVLPYGLAHIVYPLKFLAAQVMTSALALVIFFTVRRYSPKQEITVSKNNRLFVFYAGILPTLVMVFISFVLGIKLKSMWGSPVLYMLGTGLFIWFPFDIAKSYKLLLKACYGALYLFAFAFALQVAFTTSAKFKINAADFTAKVGAEKFDYAGGSVWLASTVGSYAANHPQILYFMTPETNPWIDMNDFETKGALVVEENPAIYRAYQQRFSKLSEPQVYDLNVTTPSGKTKQHKLYYGIIAGEQK